MKQPGTTGAQMSKGRWPDRGDGRGGAANSFVFSSTLWDLWRSGNNGRVGRTTARNIRINRYGGLKRAIEDIAARISRPPMAASVIFGYFNVAGADPEGEVGEFASARRDALIPLMLGPCHRRETRWLTIFLWHRLRHPPMALIRDLWSSMRSGRRPCVGVELGCLRIREAACFNLGHRQQGFFRWREGLLKHSREVTNRAVPMTEGDGRQGDWHQAGIRIGPVQETELGWLPNRSRPCRSDRATHGDGTKPRWTT